MFTKVRNRLESDKGFTLIELLVVILIIGILAAIAIPSFLNQREKGQDACAKSMARTMQTAMETYFVDNNTYNNATAAALTAIENQIATGACGGTTAVLTGAAGTSTTTNASCTGGNPGAAGGYCVSAQSSATGGGTHIFAINRAAAGAITRVCSPVSQGGCLAGGSW
ncbi:MAG: prepilin-type N-terminal cleavage/methylation domain-containing protein [Solirubrobacterales bacterium]